jgi:SsrA-binding protein
MGEIKVVASNRRARHDYFIDETFEAGLSLMGTEVKSLRQGRASLAEAFVTVEGGEAWLENAHIPEYTEGTWTNHSPRRKRKLLLHADQIAVLAEGSREKGSTVVALQLYFVRGKAKVQVGVGRGKKLYDKRQTLREQQDAREAARAVSMRAHR